MGSHNTWGDEAWGDIDLGDWQALVDEFWASAPGQQLSARLRQRYAAGAAICPRAPYHPLRALALTPLAQVRVVILGQDPYHGLDHKSGQAQAEGLAFSVPPGVQAPPSLRNIWSEIQRDLGRAPPLHGSLRAWAEQGVLLLNTCLTVEASKPASHANWGWEVLTNKILQAVAQRSQPCVYLLWGAHAQRAVTALGLGQAALGGGAGTVAGTVAGVVARAGVASAQALILEANHPSPLSARRGPRPFIGCGHFGLTERWLAERGLGLRF